MNKTSATGGGKRLIVLSGINIFRGGTLKIMRDCIAALSGFVDVNTEIIALVHNRELYREYPNVRYIAYPRSRKSWLWRLYYEYFGLWRMSKRLNPWCWFSIHDTTPNVVAQRRMVYCHNSFPFYRLRLRDLFLQPGIAMLCLFSYYIYRINIHKNDYIIVQQEWFRHELHKFFGIDNIIVSLPDEEDSYLTANASDSVKETGVCRFFYPSTPMIHKNIETACEAAVKLQRYGIGNFELVITLDGTENRYAKYIYGKYCGCSAINFTGYLKHDRMQQWYEECSCLVFPSKVETWGLPLSEAKQACKPILVSDLPYARETVGGYDRVRFFNPDDSGELAGLMQQFMEGRLTYETIEADEHRMPFARNWNELFQIIMNPS
ncbi:MAG: glycosyltransferase [Dysgonamonadaceae bacterium]|jgi:glycosyltransferase involved in cell wall biosynthesis|nr:glycosyltransferase [Dysgonamonadaceae bacterium]